MIKNETRNQVGRFAVALILVALLVVGVGGWFSAARAEEGTPADTPTETTPPDGSTTDPMITATTPEELAAAVDTVIAELAGTLSDVELTGLKQQLLHELDDVLSENGSVTIDLAQLKTAADAAVTASLPTGQTLKLLRYLAEATTTGADTTALQDLLASGQLDPDDLERALRDLTKQAREEEQVEKREQKQEQKEEREQERTENGGDNDQAKQGPKAGHEDDDDNDNGGHGSGDSHGKKGGNDNGGSDKGGNKGGGKGGH